MTPSPRFLSLLEEMKATHIKKSAGYAGKDNPDTFANFRKCERIGIPAWKGCVTRLMDKYERMVNVIGDKANEQIGETLKDTLIDQASYCLITICLLEELERPVLHTLTKEQADEIARQIKNGW